MNQYTPQVRDPRKKGPNALAAAPAQQAGPLPAKPAAPQQPAVNALAASAAPIAGGYPAITPDMKQFAGNVGRSLIPRNAQDLGYATNRALGQVRDGANELITKPIVSAGKGALNFGKGLLGDKPDYQQQRQPTEQQSPNSLTLAPSHVQARSNQTGGGEQGIVYEPNQLALQPGESGATSSGNPQQVATAPQQQGNVTRQGSGQTAPTDGRNMRWDSQQLQDMYDIGGLQAVLNPGTPGLEVELMRNDDGTFSTIETLRGSGAAFHNPLADYALDRERVKTDALGKSGAQGLSKATLDQNTKVYNKMVDNASDRGSLNLNDAQIMYDAAVNGNAAAGGGVLDGKLPIKLAMPAVNEAVRTNNKAFLEQLYRTLSKGDSTFYEKIFRELPRDLRDQISDRMEKEQRLN